MVYLCEVCLDNRERTSHHCKQHEQTDKHQQALQQYHRPSTESTHTLARGYYPSTLDEVIIDDAVRALLASATSDQSHGLPSWPQLRVDRTIYKTCFLIQVYFVIAFFSSLQSVQVQNFVALSNS